MSYTFGAASSDNLYLDPTSAIPATTSLIVTGGWYYPTTLTSARKMWSMCGSGGAFSVACDVFQPVSNMEVRVIVGRATSSGSTRTNGFNMTTGKWWFIGTVCALVSSAPIIDIWIGDETSFPQRLGTPFTVSTGSGILGSNNHMLTGCDSLSSVQAWQGDVGLGAFMYTGSSGNANFFGMAPADVTGAPATDWLFDRFIAPIYQRRFDKVWGFGHDRNLGTLDGLLHVTPMMNGARCIGYGTTTPTEDPFATINGATWSTRGDPAGVINDRYWCRPRRGRR